MKLFKLFNPTTPRERERERERESPAPFSHKSSRKSSRFLSTLFTSLIAGLIVAGIVMAWTGPSANPPSGDPAFWRKSNNDVYYNVSNGNVGIGTTTPAYKLDVNGTFRAATSTFSGVVESTSGGFKFPDGTTQTTNSFRGALVYVSSGVQNIIVNSQDAVIFNNSNSTEAYDTDNIHNPNSNNTRLTVPSGVTYVKLLGNIYFDGVGLMDKRWGWMRKNGGQMVGQPYSLSMGDLSSIGLNIVSPVLSVQGGDYFELIAMVNPTTSIRGTNGYDTYVSYVTWFSMEIIK